MNSNNKIIDIDNSQIVQSKDKLGFSTVVYGFSKFIELPNLNLENYKGIDLGCGVGSLSLLLLEKFKNLKMTGIDIDKDSLKNSIESAKLSKVDDFYIGLNLDIKNIKSKFREKSFNLIVSNPPYFKVGAGKISPKLSMARAKHEVDGKLEDFIDAANYLMKPSSNGYILQHVTRTQELFFLLSKNELVVSRVQFIYTNGGIESKNIMVEFKKRYSGDIKVLPPLILKNGEIVDGA